MSERPSREPTDTVAGDLYEFLEIAANQSWPLESKPVDGPKSFRIALGRRPIQLAYVEYRILLFLAGRPYHAFKRRAIAEAVTSEWFVVNEENVDEHVASLRDQLGVLHDYVQTVPHIGYRFKA